MSGPWMIAFSVLTGVVVILVLIVFGILRRVSVVLEQAEAALQANGPPRPSGLPPGTRLPAFEGVTCGDSHFASSSLRGTPAVLVLLGRDCPSCRALEAELAAVKVSELGVRVVAIVNDAEHAERLRRTSELEVVQQLDHSVAKALQSTMTPHAFVIDAEGVIEETGIPSSFESLRALTMSVRRRDQQTETREVARA